MMTDEMKKKIKIALVLIVVGALMIRYVPHMLPERPNIPELRHWAVEMRNTYSSAKAVSLEYLKSGDLEIMVKVNKLDNEQADEIKQSLSELIRTEEFHEKLHADASEDYGDEYLWASGFWPEIKLIFRKGGKYVRRSYARYYNETYNSGMTVDDYTYDGYNTWHAY